MVTRTTWPGGSRVSWTRFLQVQTFQLACRRVARVSWLKVEGVTDSPPTIESGRGFTTVVVEPRINAPMDSSLAETTPSKVLFLPRRIASRQRMIACRTRLNRNQMENEQLLKLILGNHAAIMAMCTCLLDMEYKVALIETGKGLLSKPNAEPLPFARWKGANGTDDGDSFDEGIPSMYLRFAFHV